MVDSDHRVPNNIDILYKQLQTCPELGGISGNIVEPTHDRIWQSAKNLKEQRDGLVRDASGSHNMNIISGSPLIKFDFVPSSILLRTDCLDDYAWDEKYTIGSEHLDFHVGHWKQTEWEFAINPAVIFEHYPGGDSKYLQNRHGEKVRKARRYFLEKWDYEFVRDKQPYWIDSRDPSVGTAIRRTISKKLPPAIYKYGKRTYDFLVSRSSK